MHGWWVCVCENCVVNKGARNYNFTLKTAPIPGLTVQSDRICLALQSQTPYIPIPFQHSAATQTLASVGGIAMLQDIHRYSMLQSKRNACMRILERLLSLPLADQQPRALAGSDLVSNGVRDEHSSAEVMMQHSGGLTTSSTTSYSRLDQLYAIMVNTPPEPLTGAKTLEASGNREKRRKQREQRFSRSHPPISLSLSPSHPCSRSCKDTIWAGRVVATRHAAAV